MSEEIELTPKVNCGVWTAIENYLLKENNEKIWDNKNVPPKVLVSRKKEKLRTRWMNVKHFNYASNVCLFAISIESFLLCFFIYW